MPNNTLEVVFLQGYRTVLRPLARADVPQITVWVNDLSVTQHLATWAPKTLEEEERWYDRLADDPHHIVFAVETLDGEFIGTMGIHGIDYRNQTAGTGALIGHRENRGRGYGTDAKMFLLHWAFQTLNLRKVVSSVLASNPRSRAYLAKTGYNEVGVRKKHRLVRGRFVDEIVVEVFRAEFMRSWREYNKKMSKKK